MDRNTVFHGQHLNVSYLAAFNNSALTVTPGDFIAAGGYFL